MFFELGPRSLKLEVLDEQDRLLSQDTGFFLQDGGQWHLYTCWHVVTGIDPRDPKFRDRPKHKKVRVLMRQFSVENGEQSMAMQGVDSMVVDLYNSDGTPRWRQEIEEKRQEDLNQIGLRVPLTFDVVRIPVELTQLQRDTLGIRESSIMRGDPNDRAYANEYLRKTGGSASAVRFRYAAPRIMTPMMVVGYPHGFSVSSGTVDPVFLTRWVAHSGIGDNWGQFYLDNPASAGMSGSPVWHPNGNRSASLAGVYVGSIFPDYRPGAPKRENDRSAAIGVVANITMLRRAFAKAWRKRKPEGPEGAA